MNESMAGGIASGGVATAPANASTSPLDDTTFRRLQDLRHSVGHNLHGDGCLSIMLCQRAGWTANQAADFLGLQPASVSQWNEEFARGRSLSALLELPEPELAPRS